MTKENDNVVETFRRMLNTPNLISCKQCRTGSVEVIEIFSERKLLLIA